MSASDAEADQIQMPQCRNPKLVEHKKVISQE